MKKKNKKKNMGQLASRKKWGVESKQADNNILKWRDFDQRADINNVVQSKENNISCRHIWLSSYNHAQFSPSAKQLNISVKVENPKADACYARPHIVEGYPTNVPGQVSWAAGQQPGRSNVHNHAAGDFTSDHLPQTGVILFNHSSDASGPKCQTCHSSAPSASAVKGTGAASPRHFNEMLRQIRRELEVREPGGADREARKQTSETSGAVTQQPVGGNEGEKGELLITSAANASVQSAAVGARAPPPDSGKSTAFKTGQVGPETLEVGICNSARITHKPGLEAKQTSSRLSLKEVNNSVKRNSPEEAEDKTR